MKNSTSQNLRKLTLASAVALTAGWGTLAQAGTDTNHLSYSLFSDTERTTVWGDGATVDVGSAGTGSAVDHTVYGRVASGQNVPAGSYADTVVATVTF